MTVLSKRYLLQIQNFECGKIIHPWHQNCIIGNLITGTSTVKGSSIFFGALYLLYYIPKYKQLTKKDIIPITKKFAISVSTGLAYMTLLTSGNCFFRNQLGQFSYHIVAYVIPILSGIVVFLENPIRKTFMTSAFASMFIEGILRRIYISQRIKRNVYFETILFMICNGLLMYIVKAQKALMKNDHKDVWIYLPFDRRHEYPSKDRQSCMHNDSCLLHGMKETMKYCSYGFFISLFKTFLFNAKVTRTKEFLRRMFMLKNLKLSIFVGTYVGIYKAVTCFLCRKTGEDAELYGLFGGILAGIPYCILPSSTLLSSLMVVLLKIMGRKLKYKYNLPNLPYQEVTFIICNAFLLNTRIFHEKACPVFLTRMMNICTDGRSNIIFGFFKENSS